MEDIKELLGIVSDFLLAILIIGVLAVFVWWLVKSFYSFVVWIVMLGLGG